MPIDDIKDGQRVKCHNVYGTVVGKRRIRDRHLVLVKMDNGFTLKLGAHTLSVTPEAERGAPARGVAPPVATTTHLAQPSLRNRAQQ